MKVAITGGTGVLGRAAVRDLVAAGHDVVAMTRSPEGDACVAASGAVARRGDLFDLASLVSLYAGCDAVVNLATQVPVGYTAAMPWSWHANDRLRIRGVRNVVSAAREAGVRRLIQESVSFVYADHGEEWITEEHPIEITPTTEPVAVAESYVHDWANGPRVGVALRFGTVIGDDELTQFQRRAVRHGRPVGLGTPDSWAHVVHTDDLGPAVVAALHAPSGVYNVGAEPVRREQLVAGIAAAEGVAPTGFLGPVLRRMAGPRIEPLCRSLRICSEYFSSQTGWTPIRPVFTPDWFAVGPTVGSQR